MSLSDVRVSNLFGRFNHDIHLNIGEHITILHGVNGVGKTTILRIIDHFFHGRFFALGRVPFHSVELHFATGQYVELTRAGSLNAFPDVSAPLEVTMRSKRGKPTEHVTLDNPSHGTQPFPTSAIEHFLPWLDQVGSREWVSQQDGRIFDLEDILTEYGDQLPLRGDPVARPEWLTAICKSIDVEMIETQRLYRAGATRRPSAQRRPGSEQRQFSAVRDLSDTVLFSIRTALAGYAARSQELDRTFPNRVLAESRSASARTDADIRKRYDAQGKKRARLIASGLLKSGEEVVIQSNLSDTERKVLSIYLSDTEAKLSVLDPIADKMDLLRDILNHKYVGKRVLLDGDVGLRVVTDLDRLLHPDSLSSGEQHELVLAHRLIFEVQPKSLILIDEPELSLHVNWQQAFLGDLSRISQVAQLDFVLATHSPTIIGKRWDLTSQLSVRDS